MTAREEILGRVRSALGRNPGERPPAPPPVRLRIPVVSMEDRIAAFTEALSNLAAKPWVGSASDVLARIEEIRGGRTAVASDSPLLAELGVTSLPNVASGFPNMDELRAACASAGVGITSADYALADTGSLVVRSASESRLVSLLPPAHIAVVPRGRLLTSLDEFLDLVPLPADTSASTVFITGPSRTADIEQILVRGVHGPGELHVLVI